MTLSSIDASLALLPVSGYDLRAHCSGCLCLPREGLPISRHRRDPWSCRVWRVPLARWWRATHQRSHVSIANIQDAVRTKNDKSYEAYSLSEYEQIKNCTLRGMLDFDFEQRTPIPIDQVEPWTEIVRRFCHWCHVVRLHLHGISLHTGRCHEPLGRQVQHW